MSCLDLSRYALPLSVAAILFSSCSGSQTPVFPSLWRAAADMPPTSAFDSSTSTAKLFVAGGSPSDWVVKIVSLRSFRPVGRITAGVDSPVGLWVDKSGNLYVANYTNVVEYAPGKRSPTCTYNTPEHANAAVTTDDENNVYVVADERERYLAIPYLDVFEQCGKLIRHSRIGKSDYDILAGVAVDTNHDIFIAHYLSPNHGAFFELVRGGRKPVRLGAVIGNGSFGSGSGGVILDRDHNLIATDSVNSVYRIKPPYKTAKVLIGNLGYPATLSLNKAETLLFSANADSRTVTVYKYPSATQIKTLRMPTGSIGVAADPDAAF